MDITILGQGFNADPENSVGHHLIKLLNRKDFHTFTGMSAFASPSGVNGLSSHFKIAKKNFKKLNLIVGVSQKGTSKEALESILSLDIKAYVFHQPPGAIFHPKIYLFEGDKTCKLIIGSSNLTAPGLFRNIETSILANIDCTIDNDELIIKELKDYFKGIFDYTDPNLRKLTKKLIKDLVKAQIVPTEAERKEEQNKKEGREQEDLGNIMSTIFPKRAYAKIPSAFKRTKPTTKKKTKSLGKKSSPGKLVWTRKKLPASSVQVAQSGTNPTGGLRLTQDRFKVGGNIIDQTTYFRKSVFGKYSWKEVNKSPKVEVATASFEVIIHGIFYGKFNLEIRHKPSGEAGQGNYTSSISWGELGDRIAKASLFDARLELYAPKGKSKSFQIVIL